MSAKHDDDPIQTIIKELDVLREFWLDAAVEAKRLRADNASLRRRLEAVTNRSHALETLLREIVMATRSGKGGRLTRLIDRAAAMLETDRPSDS